MKFIEIFILFLIGSISGYIIELISRNIFSKQKINPGFLKGPYLPIWGIAMIILFFISESQTSLICKIILLISVPIILELIVGLIFKNYFKISLWDYSNNLLNFKGIICPLYSFFWAALTIFYYFMHPLIKNYLLKILANSSYIFFYGIVAGIFLLDVFYSFNIAFKIRKIRKRIRKRYINFKEFKHASDLLGDLKDKIEITLKEKLKRE